MDDLNSSQPCLASDVGSWLNNEDDWQGRAGHERRKVQNRRNQRALRTRKRQALQKASSARNAAACMQVAAPDTSLSTSPPPVDMTKATLQIINLVKILEPEWEGNQRFLQHFEAFANRNYWNRIGALHLLPSLSQFNFIKALFANMEVLGLSDREMEDEALSPFNDMTVTTHRQLPQALQPTELQCKTPHHPWIDLLPMPTMRDNIFRQPVDSFEEDELCHAMRGQAPDNRPGLLVWRDPWDSSGWEVTEDFIRSWGWVLVGCADLLHSTNAWRAKRGERPISPSWSPTPKFSTGNGAPS